MTTFDKSQVAYLPYERGQFNFQLSKARCKIEKTFGILKKKFRYLARPSKISWARHIKLVNSILVLYNLGIDYQDIDTACFEYNSNEEFYNNQLDQLRQEMGEIHRYTSDNTRRAAGQQRRQSLIDRFIQ
eukprot:NODE_361_length_8796_cov_0.460274.p7 type:complete len:130 gc:universal NODE_361_length_8796_cov_0.460274:1322-933(-)